VSGEKRKKIKPHPLVMIFIIVLATLSLDQLIKFLITKNLFQNQSIPIIKGIFHITLVHNRGAAFGILKNQIPLFIITSLFAIILIYFNLKENRQSKSYSIALSLILAGALGNLVDRLFFGYVIDFLDFRIWPVFNVADSAITIGAILLGWSILFKKNVSRNL
jgi:signal peptidase II